MSNSGNKKTVKFVFTAQIHRLSIKKNIKFTTKIIWKRHNNKTQTQMQQHQHGISTFNQKVQLQINLVWDQEKQVYQDKNTEIVAVIEHQGKVKSGGYIKYNIAQIVNNNLKNKLQTIQLTQCPDPNAFVEITFDYSNFGQNLDASMSMLNVSSRDLNMSRIDFNDDKLSLQINRINSTVNKLNDLTSKVKNKQNQISSNIPKLKTTIDMLQGQKSVFKKQFETTQKLLKKKQTQHHQQKMSLLKQVTQLQKQLQKKQKQIKSQHHIELQQQKNNKKSKQETNKYKKLYEQAIQQIEELKQININKSMNIKANFDDVQEMANFDNSDEEDEEEDNRPGKAINTKKMNPSTTNNNLASNKKTISASQLSLQEQLNTQQLKKKNEELKQNIANMSYKLAALFNASFEYGGAKLLDHLQTAIGLTERE